jgi:hypothetical protein
LVDQLTGKTDQPINKQFFTGEQTYSDFDTPLKIISDTAPKWFCESGQAACLSDCLNH